MSRKSLAVYAAMLMIASSGLAKAQDVQPSNQVNSHARAPVALRTPVPRYPIRLLLTGVGGEAKVRFWVEQDGTVTNPSLHESSGSAELDKVATDGVLVWRYAPALNNEGLPVRSQMQATIGFDPTNDLSPEQVEASLKRLKSK
ncbi:energy transducer TonB [Xanthomonas sp. NCPPB 1068]|uniref:energy transducer TonB n=1 Tax=Xanthomonas sp. NCPPB 1068 TaxID=487525 RepID=UPI003557B05D